MSTIEDLWDWNVDDAVSQRSGHIMDELKNSTVTICKTCGNRIEECDPKSCGKCGQEISQW